MSRFSMIAACIFGGLMLFWFAGSMAIDKIPGWGWFLLAGCAVWGTGINVFSEGGKWSKKHPMKDDIDPIPGSTLSQGVRSQSITLEGDARW